jgi:hypothetical protein
MTHRPRRSCRLQSPSDYPRLEVPARFSTGCAITAQVDRIAYLSRVATTRSEALAGLAKRGGLREELLRSRDYSTWELLPSRWAPSPPLTNESNHRAMTTSTRGIAASFRVRWPTQMVDE